MHGQTRFNFRHAHIPAGLEGSLLQRAFTTDFEKKHIRNTVMFYSYMRRNQDLFWRTLLENPSRILGQLRTKRSLGTTENSSLGLLHRVRSAVIR